MTKQLTFKRTVIINRPVDQVAEYISDLDRSGQWRADLIGSTATPPGPAKRGTVIHEVVRVMNRHIAADVLVDDVTRTCLTFSRHGAALPATGRYSWATLPEGTAVTSTLTIRLDGQWVMSAAYLRQWGERMVSSSLAALKYNLEDSVAQPGA
jgi:uncharacterized membrane protein